MSGRATIRSMRGVRLMSFRHGRRMAMEYSPFDSQLAPLRCHGQQRGFLSMPSMPKLPEFFRPGSLKEYKDRKLLKYSQQEFYDVVANVEDYDKFIPWCTHSHMSQPQADPSSPPGTTVQHGELGVGFKSFQERYVSVVTCREPHMVKAVSYNSSLFKELCTIWRFSPNIPKTLTTAVASEEETKPEGAGQTRETFVSPTPAPLSSPAAATAPSQQYQPQPKSSPADLRPILTAVKVFGPSVLPYPTASLSPPSVTHRSVPRGHVEPATISSATTPATTTTTTSTDPEVKKGLSAQEDEEKRDARISSPSNLGTMQPSDYPSCWVEFEIRFEFASPLHASMSSLFFDQVSKEMLKAFVKRCEALYGKR